jgi:hypothetical protein
MLLRPRPIPGLFRSQGHTGSHRVTPGHIGGHFFFQDTVYSVYFVSTGLPLACR